MKIKRELVAIMDNEGSFLREYSNNDGTLTFNATWAKNIENASTIPVKYYEEQKEKLNQIAKLFDGQLVKVKVKYGITTLDGKKINFIKDQEVSTTINIDDFIKAITGGLD